MLTLYAYLPLNNFVKNILGVEKASRFLLVTTNVICLFPSKEPEWCLKDVFVFFPWEKKKRMTLKSLNTHATKRKEKIYLEVSGGVDGLVLTSVYSC